MTPLCEMAKRHRTDKFWPHNYTPIYHRFLGDRTTSVKKLLEIGIATGRSLRLWEEYFPNAKIVGIDYDRRWLINEGRIVSFEGNQRDKPRLMEIARLCGGDFDVIIDDGSHRADRQISAMTALLPFLAPRGIYFIEDILGDLDQIIGRVPEPFTFEVFEGGKMRRDATGMGERLMVIQQRNSP